MRLSSGSVGYPQVFVRLQTTGLNVNNAMVRYVLYVDNALNRAVLARQSTGTSAVTLSMITLSPALNTTDTYRLGVRATGTDPVAVSGYVERLAAGVWTRIGQASVSDSSTSRIREAGSVGFGGYTEASYSFDNFVRSDVGTAPTNPVPVTSALAPSSAPAGDSGFTLTVSGSNFVPGSVVRWNGSARTTTYVSSTALEAQISPADLSAAGNVPVTVFNPAPGGGVSNSQVFTVTANPSANPVPALASLAPSGATAGGSAFVLSVNGTGFASNAVVRWNGVDRPTTFASPTQLTANIAASDIAAPGSATVTVFNPTPGGGISNALGFTIAAGTSPVPVLDRLSPNSSAAGQPGLVVDVEGSGFAAGSSVRWNGSARPTTYVSATRLQVSLSASDLQSAGVAAITVNTPSPGGGTSGAQSFFVMGAGQTLFFDDFDRADGAALGNGWVEKNPAAFALASREASKQQVQANDWDNVAYRPAVENRLDGETLVEFRVRSTTPLGYPQIYTRLQTGTAGTPGGLDTYLAYVNDTSRQVVLARQRGSTLVTLSTFTLTSSLNTASRYRLRLNATGTATVQLSAAVERFNGAAWELIGSGNASDSSSSRISTAGSAGFSGYTEASYAYDNFARR
jgi:hypothetical protein